MYGKVIGTSIAVDCFDEVTKNGIYFLTEGQLSGPVPPHVDRVYTSTHNAWLLQTKFQLDPEKIVSLPTNQKFLIQDKVKKLDFYVTLMDAKQKPGAVMFLFEGEAIGNILYAGKCCYSDNFFTKPLCNFLKVKLVDYLYVHAACEDCHSHSMTTTSAVEDIINVIRWNPNCKIIINEPNFREDILINLKNRLRKPICVSEGMMKHLEELGLGTDFTMDQSIAQVVVTDQSHGKIWNSFDQPVFKIILIPCSMKLSSQEIQVKLYKLEKKGYHVIFYRNHCSPPELVNLVRDINAKHTILIRPLPRWRHPADRPKDLFYWAHLGDFSRVIKFLDRFSEEAREMQVTNVASDIEIINVENTSVEELPDVIGPNEVLCEADAPDSFILIDSDIESITSQHTLLNAQQV